MASFLGELINRTGFVHKTKFRYYIVTIETMSTKLKLWSNFKG